MNAVIQGLKDWPPEDRPPVAIPFFAFRIMVGIGVLMLGLTLAGLALRWRGRLFGARALPAAVHAGCIRSASSPCWPAG